MGPGRNKEGSTGLVANPLESPCGDQTHNQEVVAPKTAGVFPCVSVLVGALEGDVEYGAFVAVLSPDAGADGAVSDFVYWLLVWCTSWRLIFHDVLFCWFNGEEEKCWWHLLASAWSSGNPHVFKVLSVGDLLDALA